tara:strand:+ start:24 stop:575 length:552 start_codon:yes stop_codon:yes gene_type:complete
MSQLYVDGIKDRAGTGGPTLGTGVTVNGGTNLNVSGVVTATTFSGNATGLTGTPDITVGSVTASTGEYSGNVTIGGTLTYEDVANVDAVGLVTARTGVRITAGGLIVSAGISTFSDKVTVTSTLTGTEGINVSSGIATVASSFKVGSNIQAGSAGIVTATDFKIGSASVATMGKAIAMAMIFG